MRTSNWQLAIDRDGNKCCRCGCVGSRRYLSAHHIIPREEGGGDHLENLITLCDPCHDIVEKVGYLRTPGLLRAGPAPSPPAKPNTEVGEDWQAWVYGGKRRPPRKRRKS